MGNNILLGMTVSTVIIIGAMALSMADKITTAEQIIISVLGIGLQVFIQKD